ncbi:hypothetical protein FIBSPDRAFT_897020 [Athelia psychrophila]|uniref:Uncharacterized protein n=1 Tax=Athelia psychrophila TaxID=1759441 RepID=A0A166CSP1_9AGAM|nr:hypothetical protein FIBSPDRAFT_897020 [Fibularhizoctonia sp. CBS 109695]
MKGSPDNRFSREFLALSSRCRPRARDATYGTDWYHSCHKLELRRRTAVLVVEMARLGPTGPVDVEAGLKDREAGREAPPDKLVSDTYSSYSYCGSSFCQADEGSSISLADATLCPLLQMVKRLVSVYTQGKHLPDDRSRCPFLRVRRGDEEGFLERRMSPFAARLRSRWLSLMYWSRCQLHVLEAVRGRPMFGSTLLESTLGGGSKTSGTAYLGGAADVCDSTGSNMHVDSRGSGCSAVGGVYGLEARHRSTEVALDTGRRTEGSEALTPTRTASTVTRDGTRDRIFLQLPASREGLLECTSRCRVRAVLDSDRSPAWYHEHGPLLRRADIIRKALWYDLRAWHINPQKCVSLVPLPARAISTSTIHMATAIREATTTSKDPVTTTSSGSPSNATLYRFRRRFPLRTGKPRIP